MEKKERVEKKEKIAKRRLEGGWGRKEIVRTKNIGSKGGEKREWGK